GERAVRAARPRDQPGGIVLADDPQETSGVSCGLCEFRRRPCRRFWAGRHRPPARRFGDHPQSAQDRSGSRECAAHPGAAKVARVARRLARRPPPAFARGMDAALSADLSLHRRADRQRVSDERRLSARGARNGLPGPCPSLRTVTVLSETLRDNVPLEVAWMSLRQRYIKVLSQIMPAGVVGVSLLLGAAAPGDAAQYPANPQLSAADRHPVAERLAAIRQAVSDIAGDTVRSRPGEQQLAWGNWWRNGGWRN